MGQGMRHILYPLLLPLLHGALRYQCYSWLLPEDVSKEKVPSHQHKEMQKGALSYKVSSLCKDHPEISQLFFVDQGHHAFLSTTIALILIYIFSKRVH